MGEIANGNGGNGNKTIAVPKGPPAGGPSAGEMVRTEFGAVVQDMRAETSANVLAAQAAAQVQARFVMAMQNKRKMDNVRLQILAACERPLFAKGAVYAKPLGMKLNKKTGKWEEAFAEGLSIRFAEEAMRALTNVMTETTIIYDDARRRIIRVAVTDLQTNCVHYKDVSVEKTVERSKLKQGQLAISSRVNSEGNIVYIVEATDDDLLVKAGGLCAKATRDKALMLVPSDIQEEALDLIYATQANKDAEDPAAARKVMVDSFASVGVMPDQLTEYVGHDLLALTPQEFKHLRAIYSAVKEGEATWADVVEQRRDFEAEKAKQTAKPAAAAGSPPTPTTTTAAAAAPKGRANVNDLAANAKAKREAAAAKPGKPEDSISKPAPAREPGGDDDEDARNRAAAAPSDDELPPWATK